MKVYCVFGIEFHVNRKLLGIYDSYELATNRQEKIEENSHWYDEVIIDEIELNQDIK